MTVTGHGVSHFLRSRIRFGGDILRKTVSLLLLAVGLFLLFWPALAERQSLNSQQHILEGYHAAVARMDPATCGNLLAAAEVENEPSLLAVEDSGIIGSIAIPALQIRLPIYAGTDEASLSSGAGLLEGSSLPLGGFGRHTVLSAHRGLPEARLFRDLDQLKTGDTFTLTVLNRDLTYQVDQILIVSPDDTSPLLPLGGEDLCTLLTCTPYGINSHRLLVRGRRTSAPSL